MLCPEGVTLQNETTISKEDETGYKKNKKIPIEAMASLDIDSFKNPKNWKKSITNFFRNQLRSTRSNDGDKPSGSKDNFEEKGMHPDQKWQSLGKVFRRQSFAEHWQKTPTIQQGESSTQNKRHAVRKVLSSYFGKSHKSTIDANIK